MSELVVDSSVVMALALEESDAGVWLEALTGASKLYMSAFNAFETNVSLERKKGIAGRAMLEDFFRRLQIELVPFDLETLDLARAAWRQYGKGRHSAALNLGDCCAYATAKRLDLPLLFKGNDFSQTDLGGARTP